MIFRILCIYKFDIRVILLYQIWYKIGKLIEEKLIEYLIML